MTAQDRGWGPGYPTNRRADMVTVGTPKVAVHKAIAPLVDWLMAETQRRGYHLNAGQCWGYSNRAVRGSTTPSNHSWGLAVDLNAPANPFTTNGELITDMPVWLPALWQAWGFTWGGAYKGGRRDPMHFEFLGTPADAKKLAAKLELVKAKEVPWPEPVVVSPPSSRTTGEAHGVKLTTNLFTVPALDEHGKGWVDLDCPWDEVVGLVGLGSSPGDDGGYWPHVQLDAQPRDAKTRVTIQGGEPHGRCSFWWKRLTND